jgi:CDP-paratose 2-epimerase
MSKPILLCTGSAGGVGLAVTKFFLEKGFRVISIDNNMRKTFFGNDACVEHNFDFLKSKTDFYQIDVRDDLTLREIFKNNKISCIIHTAAQPSHDKAAYIPILDFDINARATIRLLELVREYCPESPFIFTSTNKVYGDNPNKIKLKKLKTRYEYDDERYVNGIDETMCIDDCTHSLFGCSKVAADLYVQEYGRYFNIPTVSFRCGCLTGTSHTGTKLHGYLSYIVKCALKEQHYTVYGYEGRQVRDNIDFDDLSNAFWEYYINPKKCGVVYNIGGGKDNSISILETILYLREKGYRLDFSIDETPRTGDHICYYSNLKKFQQDYPSWKIKKSTQQIIDEIIASLVQ